MHRGLLNGNKRFEVMSVNIIATILASGNSDQLISIINANPSPDSVSNLIKAFIVLSGRNPEKTDVYAFTLVNVRNSGKVSKINIGEPQDENFDTVFYRYLYHHLTALLYEDQTVSIKPGNMYILASLISGTAIRTGLCFSSAQIGEIARGLHFAGSDYKLNWGPELYEINAVGACVHVVAAGNEVYKGDRIKKAKLKKRLGKIGNYIKDPAGKRILNFTQLQVKNDFSNALSVADFWNVFFP